MVWLPQGQVFLSIPLFMCHTMESSLVAKNTDSGLGCQSSMALVNGVTSVEFFNVFAHSSPQRTVKRIELVFVSS